MRQLHGLGNRCGDRTHLVGLCAFLHHPMQNLQQLSGVVPAIDIEVLNDLLIGLMDVKVRGARFKPPLGCGKLKAL